MDSAPRVGWIANPPSEVMFGPFLVPQQRTVGKILLACSREGIHNTIIIPYTVENEFDRCAVGESRPATETATDSRTEEGVSKVENGVAPPTTPPHLFDKRAFTLTFCVISRFFSIRETL